MFTLAQAPHGLLTAPAAKFLDLTSPQPVGQAPAVVGATGAVDDVGEVLEAVWCYRVCLPGHGATPPRTADTGDRSAVGTVRPGGRVRSDLARGSTASAIG